MRLPSTAMTLVSTSLTKEHGFLATILPHALIFKDQGIWPQRELVETPMDDGVDSEGTLFDEHGLNRPTSVQIQLIHLYLWTIDDERLENSFVRRATVMMHLPQFQYDL